MGTQKKWITARDFFSSLRWDYSNSDIPLTVFFQSEINTIPLRWLKNILLERVGLTTEIELRKSIFRFNIGDFSDHKNKIHDLYEKLAKKHKETLIIMKVVYFDQAGHLPIFQIHSPKEINSAIKLAKKHSKRAVEIWLCWTEIASENLSGRIAFQSDHNSIADIVELVWHGSPRQIEKFQQEGFSYPFIRAHKELGSRKYQIDYMNIPNSSKKIIFQEQMINDFYWTIISIYRRMEGIEKIKEIFFGAGAKELCLEFIVRSGKVVFTDWDTEIETAL